MKLLRLLVLLILLVALGCQGAFSTPFAPPSPSPTLAQEPIQVTPSAPTPTPTEEETLTLRVWLPPQFDPAQDTAAAILLRQRLNQFQAARPRLQIEVRIKAASGPGNLLEALTTASAAAPRSLPDLIALPRQGLETAALKGLLSPYPATTSPLQDQDWYDYARELGSIQNSVYGVPFAGDALLLITPAQAAPPPATWEDLLEKRHPLLFAAGEPQALFTLAQYRALGGVVQDEQGRPFLDSALLTQVFTFYAQAEQANVLSAALIQYQSDDQAWAAFSERPGAMLVTWCSRYLPSRAALSGEPPLLVPLPTADGQAYSLAQGWVWALATRQSERQRVAGELAAYLTESAFLAAWSEAAGYLPPRPSALLRWKEQDLAQALDAIARAAHILPPAEVLSSVSKALWEATTDVLRGQTEPANAAQEAANLANP